LTAARSTQRAVLRAAGEDVVLLEVIGLGEGTALQSIDKRRHGPGYAYRGLIEVHKDGQRFRIETDMTEGNRTGTREAMVSAARMQCGEFALGAKNADGSFKILGFSFDAYDPAFDDAAENSVADDEDVDLVTPGHPLTRTRALHRTIVATLRTGDGTAPHAGVTLSDGERPVAGLRRQLTSRAARVLFGAAKRHDLVEHSLKTEIANLDSASSARLAGCLLELGVFFQVQERPGEALPHLRRAHEMLTELVGEEAPQTVVARTHHGYALFQTQQHAEALPLLVRSIEVLEETQPDSMIYVMALNGAGQILAEQDDPRASDYLEELRRITAPMEKASPPRRTH
jgi:Tetratricopeptide repeat